MPDDQFFKFLSESLPCLTEDALSQRWEKHAEIPWGRLPTEAKLEWAQVATLARVVAAFGQIQSAYLLFPEKTND